jgi:purine-binding chemotaxis protein CheW
MSFGPNAGASGHLVHMADGTDVLEFGLEDERYCVDISYVSEIVGLEELTSVPNTPDYVMGVMDLRGRSLQVRDPKLQFGVDGEPTGERVVVMAPEIGPEEKLTGWLVDSVHDVLTVHSRDLDDDVDGKGVHGALRPGEDEEDDEDEESEGRMVIWVDPVEVFG